MSTFGKRGAALGKSATLLVALSVISSGAAPASTRADDSVGRARAYLTSAQGMGFGTYGIPVIDAAEAVAALPNGPDRDAAVFALSTSIPDNEDAALMRLAVLRGTPFEDPVAAAAVRTLIAANELGLAPEAGGADPLVVARAVAFAAQDPIVQSAVPALLSTLANQQRPDGGFAFADNDSDLALTADVVRTLRGVSAAAQIQSLAGSYLARQAGGSLAYLPAADVALAALALRDGGGDTLAALLTEILSRQDADGSFDAGDVRATALAAEAMAAGLADLTIVRQALASTAPATGSDYVIPLNVRNGGLLGAPSVEGTVSVTDSTGQVVYTGSFTVPALAAGATASVNVDLGAQGAVGNRVATLIVNASFAFPEASYDNNVLTVQYRVAGLPDLAIAPSDISATPSPPSLYQSLDVSVRVRNVGDATAERVHVQLFQGDPLAGGALIGETVFNAVASGVPRTLTARVVPATVDPIRLVARVDPENAIQEASKENNVASIQVTPVAPADILVDVVADYLASRTVNQGDAVSLSYSGAIIITRFGTSYPDWSRLPFKQIEGLFTMQQGGATTVLSHDQFPVSGYAEKQQTVSLTTSGLTGVYQLSSVFDPNGLIQETNKANNSLVATLTVVTPNLPELWIDPASLTVSPSSLPPGTVATLQGRLRNTGLLTANNIPVAVVLPTATGATVTTTQIVATLAPGSDVLLTATLDTTKFTPGAYTVTWQVDPQSTIQESSRQNNNVSQSVRVAGADLTITSVTQTPLPAPTGSTATVVINFRNDGVLPTGQTYASITTPSVSATGASVAPGGTGSITLAVPTKGMTTSPTVEVSVWDGALGRYWVKQSYVLQVSYPDFSVTPGAVALVPEGAPPGSPAAASISVSNLGTLDASTSVHVYRGYPQGGDLAVSGSVFVAAGGAAVFTTPQFALPAQSPFVITVVLNEEAAYPEPNLANNTATRETLRATGHAVVAFDESHRPVYSVSTNPAAYTVGDYFDWAADLRARGYTVTTLNPDDEGLTPSKLRNVDVLVMSAPINPYLPREMAALKAFLQGGGGFLFMGDYGQYSDWALAEDQFLAALDVGLVNADTGLGIAGVSCSGVYPHFQRSLGEIATHSVTQGVTEIWGAATGAFRSVPSGATVLVSSGPDWTTPNAPVAGVFPLGTGRVGFIADTDWFDAQVVVGPPQCGQAILYDADGNRRFGLQMIDWLVNGGPTDYLPDLAFVPSNLTADVTSPKVGDTVNLSFTVKNIGGTLAPDQATTVRLYDGDPAEGQVIANLPLDPLAVDEGRSFSFAWTASGPPGVHVVTAVIDPDNLVREANEDDNVAIGTLTVLPAVDLRLDPSDLSVAAVAGQATPMLSARVHNTGYATTPVGAAVELIATLPDGTQTRIARVALPAIGARSAVTVTAPWMSPVPTGPFTLTATADPDGLLVDFDRTNNAASIGFVPPALDVRAPLANSSWGGVKTAAWTQGETTRSAQSCVVAVAPAGSDGFNALPGTSCAGTASLDTRQYADGPYVLRVTVSNGVQTTAKDVPFQIDNTTPSVRTFVGTGSPASVTLPSGAESASVAIPVGVRVLDASLAAVPAPAFQTTMQSAALYDTAGVAVMGGTIYAAYLQSNQLVVQASADEGATWSAPRQLTASGVQITSKALVANGSGLHLFYATSAGAFYLRSRDGSSWSAPLQVGPSGPIWGVAANEQNVVVALSTGYYSVMLAVANAGGTTFGPATLVPNLTAINVQPVLTGGLLHLFYGNLGAAILYRSVPLTADLTSSSSYGAEVNLGNFTNVRPFGDAQSVGLAYRNFVGGAWNIDVQRCLISRGCSQRDSWLPEPVVLNPGGGNTELALRASDGGLGLYYAAATGGVWRARSFDGGASWSQAEMALDPYHNIASNSGVTFFNGPVADGAIATSGNAYFYRLPGLAPTNLKVDVGATGTAQLAVPGMLVASQGSGLASAFNSYLSTHADGDDGVVDGFIRVPVAIASGGAGSTQLANLEVRYQPLTSIAGYADPPIFSPGTSPGVLDTASFSLLGSGNVVIADSAGNTLRTLPTTPSASRYVAAFDGNDATGNLLPSGVYSFGPAGAPVAQVEIDDVPPTVGLDVSSQGSYGGLTQVRGFAIDADWAGTTKNFSRYTLEYTVDGTTYTSIAVGTAPIDGVLGTWDLRPLSTGSATLRLTAWDVAGNSTSVARTVSVSPGAPAAPVISAPTVAGNPIDSLTPAVRVAGAAEPRATVTVYVNGVPAGTAPSDGQWSLAGVPLDGASSITATATRDGLTGPPSQPIQVARYALAVGMSLPSRVTSGATAPCVVTVTRTSVSGTPVTVQVTVVDSAGEPAAITVTPTTQVVALAGQGSASYSITLDTGLALPADYTVVARVVSGGLQPASVQQTLTLDPLAIVTASVATDKASYDALDLVQLSLRIGNAGFSATGPLSTTVEVVDPTGAITNLGPFETTSIPAAQYASWTALSGSTPLGVGTYLVTMSVSDSTGAVVATAGTSFQVQPANGTGALAGTLAVSPATFLPGDSLAASFTVTNNGGDAQIPVSLLLMEQATSAVVARYDETIYLAAGATAPGSAVLSTQGASGGALIAVLVANGRGLAGRSIEPSPWRDTTPPTITITGVAQGEYRSGPVTPVITVVDPDSPFTWAATLSGHPFTSGTTISTDEEYDLVVTARDIFGNASAASRHFTIDTTPPLITVAGISDGLLVNHAVQPVVTVTDLHGPVWTTLLDGAPWAGGPVSAEGDHVLSIQASDAAGNTSQRSVRFSIDLTPPVIQLTGVADGGVYTAPVTPVFRATDLHGPTVAATLDGAPFTAGTVVATSGTHLLSITARDAAGNSASLTARFEVTSSSATLSIRYDDAPRVLVALDCGGVASCASTTAELLLTTLDHAGVAYDVALDRDSLRALFRSFRHNVRILYLSQSAESSLFRELREATFAGGGLIVVNDVPADADPSLVAAQGASVNGKIRSLGKVSLAASDLGAAGSVTIDGAGIVQAIHGATPVGTTSSGAVVLSTYPYGTGRTVTLTLNPEQASTVQPMSELLLSAVRFVAGSGRPAMVPGVPAYLELVAALTGPGSSSFRLDATIPAGMTVLDAPLSTGGTSPSWLFTLDTSQSVDRSLVVTSRTPGNYSVEAVLTAIGAGEVAHAGLDLSVAATAGELRDRAVAAVNAIAVSGADVLLESDALSNLSAVNPSPTTQRDAQQSIGHVLHAIDGVLAMSAPSAADARAPLDALLRALEVESVTLP